MNSPYKKLSTARGIETGEKKGLDDKIKGTMEDPHDYMTMHGKKNSKMGAKDIMNRMKYAPKTVSYDEFTSAKRNSKMQSMIGATKDESTTKGMEKLNVSKLPSHKATKSFDIDVTKYKPRTARAMKNK
jgi:hypothetical protein